MSTIPPLVPVFAWLASGREKQLATDNTEKTLKKSILAKTKPVAFVIHPTSYHVLRFELYLVSKYPFNSVCFRGSWFWFIEYYLSLFSVDSVAIYSAHGIPYLSRFTSSSIRGQDRRVHCTHRTRYMEGTSPAEPGVRSRYLAVVIPAKAGIRISDLRITSLRAKRSNLMTRQSTSQRLLRRAAPRNDIPGIDRSRRALVPLASNFLLFTSYLFLFPYSSAGTVDNFIALAERACIPLCIPCASVANGFIGFCIIIIRGFSG